MCLNHPEDSVDRMTKWQHALRFAFFAPILGATTLLFFYIHSVMQVHIYNANDNAVNNDVMAFIGASLIGITALSYVVHDAIAFFQKD